VSGTTEESTLARMHLKLASVMERSSEIIAQGQPKTFYFDKMRKLVAAGLDLLKSKAVT
jgi:hypothetical protein